MSDNAAGAVPLLGDIPLQSVQRIEHRLDGGFDPVRIPGLTGELQHNTGRLSHEIHISGNLFGEDAAGQLESLQQAAGAGEELTFAADVTSALELQKVVISHFRAVEVAAQPNTWHYQIGLRESPPLPPPVQVQGFGGLDDFGLGDLGFDTDILGDLQDLAGDVAGALDDALGLLDSLGALADLAALSDLGGLGGFLAPMEEPVNQTSGLGDSLNNALGDLGEAFSTD